jgi:hypothetical protein
MGAVGTMWEPDVAIWEADGAIWEPHTLCGDHLGAMCTMLEPCVPYGSHVGARWCHLGCKWGPYGSGVCCMGATCAMWELDGAIWKVYTAI